LLVLATGHLRRPWKLWFWPWHCSGRCTAGFLASWLCTALQYSHSNSERFSYAVTSLLL